MYKHNAPEPAISPRIKPQKDLVDSIENIIALRMPKLCEELEEKYEELIKILLPPELGVLVDKDDETSLDAHYKRISSFKNYKLLGLALSAMGDVTETELERAGRTRHFSDGYITRNNFGKKILELKQRRQEAECEDQPGQHIQVSKRLLIAGINYGLFVEGEQIGTCKPIYGTERLYNLMRALGAQLSIFIYEWIKSEMPFVVLPENDMHRGGEG